MMHRPGSSPSLSSRTPSRPALLVLALWSSNVDAESCANQCKAAGFCCEGHTSSWNSPSCAMGCLFADLDDVTSEELCKAECKKYDKQCNFQINGQQWTNCQQCPCKGGEAECADPDRCRGTLDSCEIGCTQAYTSSAVIARNWGGSFLLVLVLAAGGYIGGGVYKGRMAGRKGGGLQVHPHFHLWQHTQALVQDGVSFVRSGGTRARGAAARSGQYETVAEAERPGTGGKSKRKSEKKAPKVENEHGESTRAGSVEKKSKRSSAGHGATGNAALRTPATRAEGSGEDASGSGIAEQFEVAPNLHTSQAKIKVVGLSG